MAENTRKDPRAKVLSMTVRYKSATLDEFIEHHSHDVSRGGMYIKTPQPFPPGTLLKFEVKIAADQKVIQGVGRVVWRRDAEEASPDHPAGMGVKFIKLDDDSRDIIDQLVTARAGDISAFDEVEPVSETAPAGVPEPRPAKAARESATEGFFPRSAGDVPQPAPEDRTVMKQATELLQEALREVGSVTSSSTPATESGGERDAIPKAPRAASVSARDQRTPGPIRVAPRIEPPLTSSAGQASKGLGAGTNRIQTPVQVKKASPPTSPDSAPAKPAETLDDGAHFEPVKPQSLPSTANNPRLDSSPKTVPATPLAARRIAEATSAQQANEIAEDYKLPARAAGGGRGLRIGIILLAIGGAAAAIVALSRKPETSPKPEPQPSLSQKVQSAPAVPIVVQAAPEAGPGPSSTASAEASASAAPSAAAAAPAAESASAAPSPAPEKAAEPEKAAAAETPKVQPAPRIRVARRKKADAGAMPAPAGETPSESESTTTPSKPSEESAGSTEPTPAPAAKSKSKASAPAPTPNPDDPYPQ